MWMLPSLFKLWPWIDLNLFNAKVKFSHMGICVGKSKTNYFLENTAALGLKVAWSIQLNKLMKLSEWSRSFLDPGQISLRFQS